MPGRLETLLGAVLAHGADPDAVGHLDSSDPERGEEFGEGIVGAAQSSSRSSLLLRAEEGNTLCWRVLDSLSVVILGDGQVLGDDDRKVLIRLLLLNSHFGEYL